MALSATGRQSGPQRPISSGTKPLTFQQPGAGESGPKAAAPPACIVRDLFGNPVGAETVEQLLRGEKVEWDRRLPGFGLRHRASGRLSWIVLTRVHGEVRRLTLGNGAVVTRAAARKKARKLLLTALTEGDPLAERKAAQAAPLFSTFTREYWRRCAVRWKPSTRQAHDVYRDAYLLPAFGTMFLDQISEAVFVGQFALWSKRRPGAANRCMEILRHMFRMAEEWGYLPPNANPCLAVKRNPPERHGRYLTEPELERFGEALNRYEARFPSQVGATRLLMLTGCRAGEIFSLRWHYVQGRVLQLGNSKSGPRQVQLGEAAVAALERIPRKAGSPWVFPAAGGRSTARTTMETFWKRRLLPAARLSEVRVHDLRHTFASHAAILQENTPIIAGLLGHRKQDSTYRYMHLSDQPAIDAAEKISAILWEALSGGKAIDTPPLELVGADHPGAAERPTR